MPEDGLEQLSLRDRVGTKERQIACLTAYINLGIGRVGWKWSAYPDAFSLCPVRCPHRDDIEVSERLFYRGALFVYRQEGHGAGLLFRIRRAMHRANFCYS